MGTTSAQTQPHNIKIIHKILSDGSRDSFMTIDSVKHGMGIVYDSLGRLEIEYCYVNGEWTGPLIFYYPNGNIVQESYVINGEYDGKSVNYYHDGTIKRITHWKMGLRDGIEETYIEDGRLDKRLLYRNDTLLYIIEDHHYLPLPPTVEPLYKN